MEYEEMKEAIKKIMERQALGVAGLTTSKWNTAY